MSSCILSGDEPARLLELLAQLAALKEENERLLKLTNDLADESVQRLRTVNELKARVAELEYAAKSLRACQKEYMNNRGNDEIGKSVAEAAKYLDDVLGED